MAQNVALHFAKIQNPLQANQWLTGQNPISLSKSGLTGRSIIHAQCQQRTHAAQKIRSHDGSHRRAREQSGPERFGGFYLVNPVAP